MSFPRVTNTTACQQPLTSLKATPYLHLETIAIRQLESNSPKALLTYLKNDKTHQWAKGNIIHIACATGHIKYLKQFVDLGVDINAKNADGETPLHIACKNQQQAAITALLDFKVNPNIPNRERQFPLELAIDNALPPLIIEQLTNYITRFSDHISSAELHTPSAVPQSKPAEQIKIEHHKIQQAIRSKHPKAVEKIKPQSIQPENNIFKPFTNKSLYPKISFGDFEGMLINAIENTMPIPEDAARHAAEYARFDLLGLLSAYQLNVDWEQLHSRLNSCHFQKACHYEKNQPMSSLPQYISWLRDNNYTKDISQWFPLLTEQERATFWSDCCQLNKVECLNVLMPQLSFDDLIAPIFDNSLLIFWITKHAPFELVKDLLNNFPALKDVQNDCMFTLLHTCMLREFTDQAEFNHAAMFLIHAGCQVNALDTKMRTFPYYAPKGFLNYACRIFFKFEGVPTETDYKNQSLLHIAANEGFQDVLQQATLKGHSWFDIAGVRKQAWDNICENRVRKVSVDVMHHFLKGVDGDYQIEKLTRAGLQFGATSSDGKTGLQILIEIGFFHRALTEIDRLAKTFLYQPLEQARSMVIKQHFSLTAQQYKHFSIAVAANLDEQSMRFVWNLVLPLCPLTQGEEKLNEQAHFIFVDDTADKIRFASANGFLLKNPNAQITAIEKDQPQDRINFNELKPATNPSKVSQNKVVIHGHGPHLCCLSGSEFARKLESLLCHWRISKERDLKVSLTSCNCGIDSSKKTNGTFLKELMRTMLIEFNRRPLFTAAMSNVIVCEDGEVLAATYTKFQNGTKHINSWQGNNSWITGREEFKQTLLNITQHNYTDRLIMTYQYNLDGTIAQHRKHKRSEGHGGLHTLKS
ncbi:ankyrin repeat domain-containing protein [Parashewanella spongiae]|uniref:Ankyrin repeat domain-containing protein n=1 Tax=Parashewanella spongiae TaxID=342950 RepID=A0A3A6U1G6_9GAMM|nr:ankyrin repeat domain-containing protein [Parashewanella spongiae]MCL1079004.1 ankyrin repeat domain-containing protein [Parashewanella spongiae]RJY17840.1 ankyrin repeat domain-containing protein [Parashewanella spongiae]